MPKRIFCYIGKTASQDGFYNGNSGNFLFNLALETFLNNPNCQVEFSNKNLDEITDFERINSNFDLVLISSANFINAKCKNWLNELTLALEKIKIPVYFIGIGLQADINDTEYKFLNKFKKECCNFIEATYKTGGNFALRGQKTAEVFEKLGYKDYWVTGCPSIFMFGKDFKINPKKLNKTELKPIINGTNCLKDRKINEVFEQYPESIFVCQDRFHKILKLNYKEIHPIKYSNLALKLRFGNCALKLLEQGRIKLFEDIPKWMHFIKEGGYNFAFGSRIHGNLISILCKIPALIYARDMRVLEMVEYFELPFITELPKKFDLYEMYENLDYTKFNENFNKKFENFQNFFDKHNIPCIVGKGINDFI